MLYDLFSIQNEMSEIHLDFLWKLSLKICSNATHQGTLLTAYITYIITVTLLLNSPAILINLFEYGN